MYELGIIGAGNMAEAIARGVLSSNVHTKEQLIATDPVEARREFFERELGVQCINHPAAVARDSKVILLAVKPQSMLAVLDAIAPSIHAGSTVISIAAGITAATIESRLPNQPVVRTMPNTPFGWLASARWRSRPGVRATSQHLAQARRLFESVGVTVDVTEDQLDAVTALSGSGPAYFFMLTEQMVKGRHRNGLVAGSRASLGDADGVRRGEDARRQRFADGTPPQSHESRRHHASSDRSVADREVRRHRRDGTESRPTPQRRTRPRLIFGEKKSG